MVLLTVDICHNFSYMGFVGAKLVGPLWHLPNGLIVYYSDPWTSS